jgi:prepilin-type N-terminal cleavage/methylation domain-containing protein
MLKVLQKGFTLVELSVVIVIIGLIVAGVTAGQSLVELGRIRSAIGDIQKYKVAYNTFYLEYNSIPGDFNLATRYWPGLTSNGNGNKTIRCNDSNPEETGFVWQHMQLAKLMQEITAAT